MAGNLQWAHRGYLYQDAIAAYILAEALVEPVDRVVVDRKVVAGDRMDDVEVAVSSRRARRQIKFSADRTRALAQGDFTNQGSSLRIDELVRASIAEGAGGPDEYRLCATWAEPAADDPLAQYLRAIPCLPTVVGTRTTILRLDADALWPLGEAPKWTVLARGSVARDDVVAFCSKFVIELAMPQASFDLFVPGALERSLLDLLRMRVGVGIYPNQGIRPEDFAAHAIFVASRARAGGETFTPADVAAQLQLRTDYGHVAQAFPLNESVEIPRDAARRALLDTALRGGLQIVTGPPGAGKSWQLTQLTRDLAEDAIVARHYCYLSPLDEDAGLRIKSDVFFGNLIYELSSQAPGLVRTADIGFGADFDRLQRLFTVAGEAGKRIVLVVDGLDHIARVLADAATVAPASTDIIEKLATLDIPEGVSIVVGSQPGEHLRPLQEQWAGRVIERTLAPWNDEDLVALARAHGVEDALAAVDITTDEIESTLRRLATRAEGNPLYARALAVDLLEGSAAGDIAAPLAWLASTEGIAGGVVAYYGHLYGKVHRDAHVVADLLGVVDFAVTQRDLEEMAGWCAAEVAPALRLLRPVLIEASGQGGVRVFHESFRQFIRERLAERAQPVAAVLAPVILWLREKGAFADARAFRFLLPALVRAARDAELWEYVSPLFVRDAVAAGHALDAISANVMLAADVARRDKNWAMLVRCLELHRAAYTTFSPSQNEWAPYVAAYAEIFGRDALSERLTFDGRPTFDHDLGLHACALVDAAGGVAPWHAYDDVEDDNSIGSDPSTDTGAFLTKREAREQHDVRAMFRCRTPMRTMRRVYRHLVKHGDMRKSLVVRGFARSAADVLGVHNVATFVLRVIGSPKCRVALSVRCHFLLGVAEVAHDLGDGDLARSLGARAVTWAGDAESMLRCLELGAPMPSSLGFDANPNEIEIAVGPNTLLHEAEYVRRWVAAVRLHARQAGGNDTVLDRERVRVLGRGWYRSWLRFVIDIAVVEASRPESDDALIAAFATLEVDALRFAGKPRACDLWPIRLVIRESLVRGLHMLRTRDAWTNVLAIIARVAEKTSSTLQGEDGGPIPTGTFVDVLVPYARDAAWGDVVLRAIEERVAAHPGTHYPFLAEFAIGMARARMFAGDTEGARRAWTDAATYLAAYGWRKDGTFYELSASFRILGEIAPDIARSEAAKVQDVADAVELHTDGKGTKYCVNDWLAAVLRLAPAAGGLLVADACRRADDAITWKTAESLRLVVDAYVGKADPLLLEHLLRTVTIGDGTIDVEERAVDRRIAPLHALAASDPTAASEAFRVTYAALADDARTKREKRAKARSAMQDVGIRDLPVVHDDEDVDPGEIEPSVSLGSQEYSEAAQPEEPQRAPRIKDASLTDIYRALRAVARRELHKTSRSAIWGETIGALADRLREMLAQGRADNVVRVLFFFAHDAGVQTFSEEPHPLAMLAAALQERGDCAQAAIAFMLAYTSTRSEWLDPFGGAKHRALVTRAMELDASAVPGVYADQVLAAMRSNSGYVDLSADVLQLLKMLGDDNALVASYHEIFAVIDGRTPQPRLAGRLPRLDEDALYNDWSLDEVAVGLLLARTSDPRVHYKVAALHGFVHALRRCPEYVARPLAWWLGGDVPRMSTILILESVLQGEQVPSQVTCAIVPELMAIAGTTSSWLVRVRAAALLERAGMTPPPATASQREVAPPPPYDTKIRNAGSQGSWPALNAVRPLFVELVERAERIAYAKLPSPEERRDRAELMWGLHLDMWPATPAILWEREALFESLDDALAELMRTAENDGDYDSPDPKKLERAMLPDLWFHVGRAASRVVRPNWERPSVMVNGEGRDELATVDPADDPRFPGWTRLAFVEEEAVMPERSNVFSNPDRGVAAWSAAIAWPSGEELPGGVWPFLQPGEMPGPYGPIVTADADRSWLGHPWRLEPPYTLIWACGLRPSALGEPIVWRDEAGEIAVAVRMWRVVRHDARAEPATFEGCDLIVRPDMLEHIRMLHGDLRVVCLTDDTPLPSRS